MTQAVSPEFKPSEASAEEDGTASRIAVVSKRFNLIFLISPPYFIEYCRLFIEYLMYPIDFKLLILWKTCLARMGLAFVSSNPMAFESRLTNDYWRI
jgi:hypothetical protein